MTIKILFGGFSFPEEVVNDDQVVNSSADAGEFGCPAFKL
jgi:hypothetical protein